MSALEAAHEDLLHRYRLADTDRGDGFAVDPYERDVLNPLVDVIDMVRRIADHPESAHYRAEKAGPLVLSAVMAGRQTMLAFADWPDDGPAYRAIDDASRLLMDLCTGIRRTMWVEARGEDHDLVDAAELMALADRFVEWARRVERRAVDYDEDDS